MGYTNDYTMRGETVPSLDYYPMIVLYEGPTYTIKWAKILTDKPNTQFAKGKFNEIGSHLVTIRQLDVLVFSCSNGVIS